ncbi:MAG: hypothetical protein KGK10_01750 [Rhodospirillales bacterium]|nr:hypothetical protein [Rhodospirillales bacterium]
MLLLDAAGLPAAREACLDVAPGQGIRDKEWRAEPATGDGVCWKSTTR